MEGEAPRSRPGMRSLASLFGHQAAAPAADAPAEVFDAAEMERLRRRWQEPHPAGGTRGEVMLERLAARKGLGGGALAEPLDLRGIRLVDADLAGLDLTGCDLSGADLSRADLERTVLFQSRLRGTSLFHARMVHTELSGADLTGANLTGVAAPRAGFGMACLRGAELLEADLRHATLTEADLRHTDLRMARLETARLRAADLRDADLSRARLKGADLDDSRVTGAVFDGADLRHADIGGLVGYDRASWIGTDIRDIEFTGAHLCRRFIHDQNYLEEFKSRSRWSRVLYGVWWVTSDCGRSLVRWALWTMLLAIAFAGLFLTVDVDYGPHRTPLSPFYFSVVTLTTLGFGDVVPRSLAAQLVVIAEAVAGYVMLGGLLSILSNKMARRAE